MPLKILKNRKSKNIHPFTVFVKVDFITGLGEIFGNNCLFDLEWKRGNHKGGLQEIPLDNSGDLRTYSTLKIPCHFTKESNSDDLDSKGLVIYLKKNEKKKSTRVAILQIDLANIVNRENNTQPKQFTSTMKGIDIDIKPYIEFTSYAQPGTIEIESPKYEHHSNNNYNNQQNQKQQQQQQLTPNSGHLDRRSSVSSVSSDQLSDISFSNIHDKEAPIPTLPDYGGNALPESAITSPVNTNLNKSDNSLNNSSNSNKNNNNNSDDPFDFSFDSPSALAANFLTEKSPTARRNSNATSSSQEYNNSSSHGTPLSSSHSGTPLSFNQLTSPTKSDNGFNDIPLYQSTHQLPPLKSPYNQYDYTLSPVQSPIPPNSPMPERRMSTDDRKTSKRKGKKADNLLQSLHRDNHNSGFFSRRRHSISDPANSAQYRKELEKRAPPSPFVGGEQIHTPSSLEDQKNIPIQSVLYSRSGDERLKFLNEEMILYKRPEYSEGVPVSSIIVYKCLFEWKEFNPHNHFCLAKVIESLDYLSSMDNMDKETSCYWLSTSYGLWYLLDCTYNQRINTKHYVAERSPNGDLAGNSETQNIKLFLIKLKQQQKQFWKLLWNNMKVELDNVLKRVSELITNTTFTGTSLYLNYLLTTLEFMEKRIPFSSLWPNIFKQIFFYTSGYYCNMFLQNTEFSNTTSAINLKLLFSSLSQWIQENKHLNFFYYYKIEMSFLLQLLDVMMIDKNTLIEESVRKDICPSIGLTQLAILLITFTPISYLEEVEPQVIKKLQDEGIRNQDMQDTSINTDILFELPESPEPSKRIFDVRIPPSVVPNKKFKFVFKPTMVY